VLAAERRRHGRRAGRLDRLAPLPRRGGGAQLGLGRAVAEAGPRVAGIGAERLGELGELLVREQRRVIGRVALGRRQPLIV
jgi:hypothetical protein